MRALFSFVGGNGHFLPMLPIANATQLAGHTVIFACGHSMVKTVEQAGFSVIPLGEKSNHPPQRIPLRPVDMQREENDLREKFAREGAKRKANYLIPICEAWQPDIIVCDETDFGAMIVGERLGIPYASVLVIASGAFVRPDVVADALNEVRAEHGLSSDPHCAMLSRYLVLSPFPPSYRHPDFPLPETAYSICPMTMNSAMPRPVEKHLADAPTIYFTLGTIFNTESGDLFSRVLAGLADLTLNVIVTVGKHIDPDELGLQPPHIHIVQYIPQEQLLPYCDLVISHGGSGSVMGALAHGLPMVLIPMGADQPLNAMRCVALGVGLSLDAVSVTSDEIREAVSTVLDEPSYRRNAEQLSDEIANLPEPSSALSLLERLAREKQPIKR